MQHLIDKFCKQWQTEYLRKLRQKQQKHSRSNLKYEKSTGNIMLIQQDKYTRKNWKMGRVTKIIKGRDGFVRAANVEKHILKTLKNQLLIDELINSTR